MADTYEIIATGTPGPVIERALVGFSVTSAGRGRVLLRGAVADQAALHGILHRLQDLRMELIDVHKVESTDH